MSAEGMSAKGMGAEGMSTGWISRRPAAVRRWRRVA
jgi:hypothetical protein